MFGGGELGGVHMCQLKCNSMLNYNINMMIVVSKSWEKSDALIHQHLIYVVHFGSFFVDRVG